MSLNYAASLKPNPNKGKCGQQEYFDTDKDLEDKINELLKLIEASEFIVAITGAGISTSCVIIPHHLNKKIILLN
jgi:NAD+-dependent protein deacetylase sirtuin 6